MPGPLCEHPHTHRSKHYSTRNEWLQKRAAEDLQHLACLTGSVFLWLAIFILMFGEIISIKS